MSQVLIIYGTTDGHTAKIASALKNELTADGAHVDVVDARHLPRDVGPEQYDGVIVAASIHARGYQHAVSRWVRRHAAALNAVPSAFLSVCLGILEQRAEAQREVRDIMDRFLARAGWHPTVRLPVAGALPYTRYSWWKKWVMKRIAARTGGDTDTTRDFEYTDWEGLGAFAREFGQRASAIHVTGAV
ncbi:MAG TPA: flavodoxin domain-containing protein [Gemmatimonadales bacterium]|nr:flavodoxin domain-containing protein [Gemmatimonadales bacterium]